MAATEGRALVSRFAAELATAGALFAFGVAVIVGALEFHIGWDDGGPQPGYFPFFIGLIICAAAVGAGAQAFFTHRHSDEPLIGVSQAKRVAAFFLPVVAFVAASVWLGLYVAMALYLFGAMTWQGRYRWPFAAAVSLGAAIAFFVIFEKLFLQPLLKGPLEAWLGIY